MRLPLLARILVPVLTVIAVGMGASSWIIGGMVERNLRAELEQQMQATTAHLERQIADWLGNTGLSLGSWRSEAVFGKSVGDGFIAEQARKQASERLGKLQAVYRDFDAIHLVDAAGLVIASSLPDQVGKLNLGDRDYIQRGLRGETVVSRAFRSKRSGRPVFALSVPVEAAGKPVAVLAGIIDLGAFSERSVGQVKIGEHGYGFLFDAAGSLIAHPDPKLILAEETALDRLPFGAVLRDGAGRMVEYAWQGAVKLAAVRRIPGSDWLLVAAIERTEIEAPVRRVRLTIVTITAITLGAVGLVVLLIALGITRPLRRAVGGLDAIAGGDLTRRLPAEGGRELAQMAEAVNRTTDGIRTALGAERVDWDAVARLQAARRDLVRRLTEASEHLLATSRSLAGAADGATAQATSVGAAAEEVSRNVQTVAAAAEEMGAAIREISQTAASAARTAGEAVNRADAAQQLVDRLGASSARIGEVVATINGIAEQTNLLALNATIEAARAGEAGRGFAVVASEVKALAGQTQGSTSDIQGRVAEIQRDVAAAVEAIRAIAGIIREISTHQSTIASAVEEQSATTQEITGNVAEAAKGSAEIAQSIQGVAEASRQASAGAGEARGSAEALAKLAEGLRS